MLEHVEVGQRDREATGCPANVKPWTKRAFPRNGSATRSEAITAPIGA